MDEAKSNDVLDEAEKLLDGGSDVLMKRRHSLDLRGGKDASNRGNGIANKPKSKLARLGKSFCLSQKILVKKKTSDLIGLTNRRLEISVISAKGLESSSNVHDEIAFTIVGGCTQFETKHVNIVNKECDFCDTFIYDVPLSTHSGDLLVKNLEVIAHCGEKVLSTAVVPLASVSGNNVEYRLKESSSNYLKMRSNSLVDGSKTMFAGVGRITLKMQWINLPSSVHKFGTSFARLMQKGVEYGSREEHESASEDMFRSPPVYPEVKKTGMRRDSKGGAEVVSCAGEEFFFEESSSVSSSESDRLVFSSRSNSNASTPSVNTPTVSPGRSDSDRSSDGLIMDIRGEEEKVVVEIKKKSSCCTPKAVLGTGTAGSGFHIRAPGSSIRSPARPSLKEKAALVDDFMHNTHKTEDKYIVRGQGGSVQR
jgi:hypothetical protein